MKTRFLAAATLSLGLLLGNALPAMAQSAKTPSAQPTVMAKKVGFRMANWRTIHSHGTKAEQELIKTLKDIGCETRQNKHGNHTDIGFRCPSWKSIDVRDEKESTQWQDWLVKQRFETAVLNPTSDSPLPTVKVRLVNWKTVHAKSAEQANTLKETYELIGCEVVVENHGNHVDTKFRCPEWNTIGLPNAQAAHVWQDWLNRSGFETQHNHSHDDHDAHAGHNHATDDHSGHDHSGHGHEH